MKAKGRSTTKSSTLFLHLKIPFHAEPRQEEALRIENEKLVQPPEPPELQIFMQETGLTKQQFDDLVRHGDATQFESRFQKKIRKIYHRYRRW